MKLSQAFTLIELLLVVAIVGLLVGLSLGPITSSRMLTRDADRKADLTILAQAVDLYSAEKRILPGQEGSTSCTGYSTVYEGNWENFQLMLESYLPASTTFPTDPLAGKKNSNAVYYYKYECDARTKSYTLTALLENKNDFESPCRDGSVPCTGRKFEIKR